VAEEPLAGGGEGDLSVALLARVEIAHAYVFQHCASIVARAARTRLRDRAQVDDVVQSVFEDLWLHPSRFDRCRGVLATFLRLQAYGRSIDLIRSESARSKRELCSLPDTDSMDNSEGQAITAISDAKLQRTLECLSERDLCPPSEATADRTRAEPLRVLDLERVRTGASNARTRHGDGPAATPPQAT
jgi:Sigma-70 region 2